MDLTTELLRTFEGGQLETQNPGEGYHYRAQITSIELNGDELVATLEWWASLTTDGWVVDDHELSFKVSTVIYRATQIGGDRLCLRSPYTKDLTVLYPKGGSRLEPSKVQGLTLS